jgi:hypothetical protein
MNDPAGFALEQKALVDEGVEMTANGRGRDAELLAERCRGLRPALEHEAGHGVAGATLADIALEFHYVSMTYFRA